MEADALVVASPGALDGFPASYITVASVPSMVTRFTAQRVGQFPSLSVANVDAALKPMRSAADQVSRVVQIAEGRVEGPGACRR